MLGLIGLSSKQRKLTMQDRHLHWPRYFFLDPAVPPNSRIATVNNKSN